jgi:UDP-N-acetylmuramoyl-L-alanyl-D-glutamate--2,6-diaminopimelate ligase
MTMPGRFALQRALRRMVDAECAVAVIETSSEGIVQHRQRHIAYDVAVFTNLTPEHIESHGSFRNYREAKGKLFASLKKSAKKSLRNRTVPKTSVVNSADPESPFFRTFWAEEYLAFRVAGREPRVADERFQKVFIAEDMRVGPAGSSFTIHGSSVRLKLLGAVNVENALAAIAAIAKLDIPLSTAIRALEKVEGVPGRLEFVQREPFGVLVDYAPEPASLEKLYDFLKTLPFARIIHVLGSTGGGRDVARRPVLGGLAGKRADIVIVTNEDPYDDDPMRIIEDVARGAEKAGKRLGKDLFTILDRREALAKAVGFAQQGDLVVVTGKGAEQAMVVRGRKKIRWDDRTVLHELLQ